MSLFQARTWWQATHTLAENDEFAFDSLCVGNVDNSPTGDDKIAMGSLAGLLRVYYPRQRDFRENDLLLEERLGAPVLQLALGKFHSAGVLSLAVLHPRALACYALARIDGPGGDQGSYHSLTLLFSHKLARSAARMCFGTFGGALGGCDSIAVESLDGLLSLFERDRVGASRFLPNFLLPGALCYLSKIDSFVVATADMTLEAFKCVQLMAGTAAAGPAGGAPAAEDIVDSARLTPAWSLSLGELCFDVRLARLTRGLPPAQSDVLVLGCKSLFSVKDSGELRWQVRLDGAPVCMLPYVLTPGELPLHNLLVATAGGTLKVFAGTALVWAARMEHAPVALGVGTFGSLRGLTVSLSAAGVLSLSYLGTDPSTSPLAGGADAGPEPDYVRMEAELGRLHAAAMAAESGVVSGAEAAAGAVASEGDAHADGASAAAGSAGSAAAARLEVTSECVVALGQRAGPATELEGDGRGTLRVRLAYRAGVANDVRVTLDAPTCFELETTSFTLGDVGDDGGGLSVETAFRCLRGVSVASLELTVLASYSVGRHSRARMARHSARLPLVAFGRLVTATAGAAVRVTLDSAEPCVSLAELFNDVPGCADVASGTALTLALYAGGCATLQASKREPRYRVQADSLEACWPLLDELLVRLAQRFARPVLSLAATELLPLAAYFEYVDRRWAARVALVNAATLLASKTRVHRELQKRVLARVRAKNPTPLNRFDALLHAAHDDVMTLIGTYGEAQATLRSASLSLLAATHVLLLLMRLQFNLDEARGAQLAGALVAPLEHASVTLAVPEECGWEEQAEAGLASMLGMSEAGPLSMPKNASRVKKSLALLCDRLLAAREASGVSAAAP